MQTELKQMAIIINNLNEKSKVEMNHNFFFIFFINLASEPI